MQHRLALDSAGSSSCADNVDICSNSEASSAARGDGGAAAADPSDATYIYNNAIGSRVHAATTLKIILFKRAEKKAQK